MAEQKTQDFLASYRSRAITTDEMLSRITKEKKRHQESGDSKAANRFLIYEEVLKTQRLFEQAFSQMKAASYYSAWCTLEQCEIKMIFMRRHLPDNDCERYGLSLIEQFVKQFQSLYPYRLFMSPEMLHIVKRCSICGKDLSIRNPCGHEPGEIYNGEMCCRIVEKSKLLGLSLVDKPTQKYSVPFTSDPKTGKTTDHYDYRLVEYAIRLLDTPYDYWETRKMKKRYPQSRFSGLSRNDPCPCGSDSKYKRCCLNKEYVELDHVEVLFEGVPADASVPSNVIL